MAGSETSFDEFYRTHFTVLLAQIRAGITISETERAGLTAACVALAIAVYNALARAAEQSRRPWLATVGRFLLGGIARKPVYVPSKTDQDSYGNGK